MMGVEEEETTGLAMRGLHDGSEAAIRAVQLTTPGLSWLQTDMIRSWKRFRQDRGTAPHLLRVLTEDVHWRWEAGGGANSAILSALTDLQKKMIVLEYRRQPRYEQHIWERQRLKILTDPPREGRIEILRGLPRLRTRRLLRRKETLLDTWEPDGPPVDEVWPGPIPGLAADDQPLNPVTRARITSLPEPAEGAGPPTPDLQAETVVVEEADSLWEPGLWSPSRAGRKDNDFREDTDIEDEEICDGCGKDKLRSTDGDYVCTVCTADSERKDQEQAAEVLKLECAENMTVLHLEADDGEDDETEGEREDPCEECGADKGYTAEGAYICFQCVIEEARGDQHQGEEALRMEDDDVLAVLHLEATDQQDPAPILGEEERGTECRRPDEAGGQAGVLPPATVTGRRGATVVRQALGLMLQHGADASWQAGGSTIGAIRTAAKWAGLSKIEKT